MCGINGFNWDDEQLIRNMNEATGNRGPDDEGYRHGPVSLGHNRLSIIDLSPRGHQPMSNEDESLWITYNGEIYNYRELRSELAGKGHRFRSETDTEVVLHAYEEYGMDCVQRFNGMWAFCIHDRTRNMLLLNRDRFGIKPLYYYTDRNRIIFSSMIAGILCHDIETSPNDRAVMEYLAYNLEDHTAATFFTNIQRLEPGGMLLYELGNNTYERQKWYHPTHGRFEGNGEDRVRELFRESVRRRTVSDVPVGSCLSGGVDSSAIVLFLDSMLDNRFQTFSYVVPGEKIDESRYIKKIGEMTDTEQYFTTLDADDFLGEFDDFVTAQEEPVTELSVYAQYRVMKSARLHGAKVLLDGQGGDEIFAGYTYYVAYYFYDLFRTFRWITLAREMVLYLKKMGGFFPHALFIFLLIHPRIQSFLFKTFMARWINHGFLKQTCGDAADPRWEKRGLADCLLLTLNMTAIPHLLRFEDKNSMRWGIESRVPFLDVELVEMALSLPTEAKLSNGETKVVFKRALHDLLPDFIRNRTDKIGFETPIDTFFRHEKIAEFCSDIIYSEQFKKRPYWKWKQVEKTFRDHLSGRKNAGKVIWKLINTEVWLRTFFPGKP